MTSPSDSQQLATYWTRVDDIMVAVFDDPTFVERMHAALVNLDQDQLQVIVEGGLRSLREQVATMETSWPSGGAPNELTGAFFAGSFQFESAVFGRWLRFKFSELNRPPGASYYEPAEDPLGSPPAQSLYSVLERDYFERLLAEAPRGDSLLFNNYLKQFICVKFGGAAGDLASGCLWVDDLAWRALRGIICSKSDVLLTRSEELTFKSRSVDVETLMSRFDSLLRDRLDDRGKSWLGEGLPANLPPDLPDALRQVLVKRLRTFVMTYFYTIMQRGPILPHTAIYQLVVPILIGNRWQGSFCGAYGVDPSTRAPYLARAYARLCNRLHTVESLALRDLPSARISVAESIVRLCTVIPRPDEAIPAEMDRWKLKLIATLKGSHTPDAKGHFRDPELEGIAGGLVTASDEVLGLLDRIKMLFAEETKDFRPQSVFLSSGPGLGKESIARLCHYLSPRSHARDLIVKRIKAAWNEAGRKVLGAWEDQIQRTRGKVYLTTDGDLTSLWDSDRSFNYRVRNCGTLHADDYSDDLFGTSTRPGLLSGASLQGGTVFLDEVNTAKREVINSLLRALESPFTIEPRGTGQDLKLNVLVVFASNVGLEALTKEPYGFNPAFVDRINAQFEIPALADRKEDIPLIVNKLLQRRGEVLGKRVRFIELAGLRVLMEIPWKRNVRMIRNFVDDVMNVRRARDLSTAAFSTIRFEEVIAAVVRGRYLSASE